MFAITLPTPAATAVTTGWATRIVGVVRSRLAPSADELEERAGWRIKTRWIISAWAALSAVSALGTALTPVLLAIPMVLIVFTPRLPFLFLAASTTNPVLFFGVALPRMLIADPIHLALGRRYGGRFVPKRAQRLMLRFGLLGVALRPTSKVLAAAGACRLRTSRVLAADAAGTIGLLVSIYVGTASVVG
jgi:hypothetical protein